MAPFRIPSNAVSGDNGFIGLWRKNLSELQREKGLKGVDFGSA